MIPSPTPAETEKDDAAGAFAPSRGDRRNDGAHSARPGGKNRDATRKPDDHSRPVTPRTADKPRGADE